MVLPKKPNRVAALLETLQNDDSPSLAQLPPRVSLTPGLARSLSENDAIRSPNEISLPWPHTDYDLSKDTLREFLEEVSASLHSQSHLTLTLSLCLSLSVLKLPLEDVEDATLLGGVRALKEIEQHGEDGFLKEKVPPFILPVPHRDSHSPLSCSLYHPCLPLRSLPSRSIAKCTIGSTACWPMASSGPTSSSKADSLSYSACLCCLCLTRCSFLRQEYSEESGCFLRDVYELHAMISHGHQLLATHSQDPSPSVPQATIAETETVTEAQLSPYNKLTVPSWRAISSPLLLLDAINLTAETIHRVYLTKVPLPSPPLPPSLPASSHTQGSHSEVNVPDSTRKDVTTRFTSSYYVSPNPSAQEEIVETTELGLTQTQRDLSFFEKVFHDAFHEVSTMLVNATSTTLTFPLLDLIFCLCLSQVRDKLTRFLMQANSSSTILNELETINGEIERAHRQTLLALQSASCAPLSSPPPPPETVTLRDPSRLLASHLGLLPTVLLPLFPSAILADPLTDPRSNQEANRSDVLSSLF
jgi:hypothetical protein